jgi:DNA-binding NarL/FixJ family response regulator
MNILLVDDHSIVRTGLIKIIKDNYPSSSIGEASNGIELKHKLIESDWNILILDISLGDINSFDLIPEIRKSYPQLKIIILSMHDEKQFIIKAMKLGINAYVTKDRAPEELLQAISSTLHGRKYLCQTVQENIVDFLSADSNSIEPHKKLSDREYEVFLLLANAESVSQIAEKLNLSVKTISTYRTRILEKLEVENNAKLMKYALDHKLTL